MNRGVVINFIPKIEYIELNTLLPKSITFDSPPEGDPFGEEIRADSTVTKSNNGTKQTQFNYLEQSYRLEFLFQTEITKQAFDDFFQNHAARGGEFNYFPSSDELEFETFSLDGKSFAPKRPIPAAVLGEFEYDFSFKIERVLSGI